MRNVFRLDVDFDAVVDFRRDVDAGERGVAALGLVEGRNAHQAVHADLAGQQSVGILAVHAERGGLDARFFARLVVVEHRLEALALGPAQIHAQQHVGPVLRLGAAGAGMDGHDGVAGVVFAGEQRFGFEPVDQLAQRIDLAAQIGIDAFAFARQFEVGGDVVAAARQVRLGGRACLPGAFSRA